LRPITTPQATIGALGTVTPGTLVGTASQGLGIQYGNTSPGATVWDWCGSAYSSVGVGCAYNAIQLTGGMWYMDYPSGITSVLMQNNLGFNYYAAAAGTCSSNSSSPSTFAQCFGLTAQFVCTSAGTCTAAGGLVDLAQVSKLFVGTDSGGSIKPATLADLATFEGGAAITSATGGTNTGTVTCATATCTNLGGTYSVVGSTFTTGTFLTLVWPTTTTAYKCWAAQN
jgi:hypothetical protein